MLELNDRHTSQRCFICGIVAVLVGIPAVYAVVYYTGGIQYAYVHAIYVPVVIASSLLGPIGGAVSGILAGVALGPLMPIDTTTGETQLLFNWVFRLVILTAVGTIVGLVSHRFRQQRDFARWIANHDLESRLPNRTSLIEQLGTLPLREPESVWMLAVVKITNLDEISGTLGAYAVDNLVVRVHRRIRKVFPPGTRGFHWHSDELAVLAPGNGNAEVLLTKIVEAVDEAFLLGGIPIHIEVIVGGTVFDTGLSPDPTEIVRQATVARRSARKYLKNVCLYADEIDQTSVQGIAILGRLRDAIDENRLEIHYQPQIALTGDKVCGFEALVRWRDSNEGFIPPGMFVSRAEETSLIHPLTEWVMRRVFASRDLLDSPWGEIPVAINVSPRNLEHSEFVSIVRSALKDSRIPPELIELEVTENALMRQIDTVLDRLLKLKGLGVTISLDDFGSGYSSLGYLQRLPIEKLKLDRSLISSIEESRSRQTVVQAAIHIARARGWRVVGEGIERPEEVETLRALGCDIGQGYLFARPLAPEDISAFIETFYVQNQVNEGEVV